MQLDVMLSPELRAVIYAMRSLERNIAKFVRQQVKRVAAPEWSKALLRKASTALERRVMVSTATVAVSDKNIRVTSANKGRPLSGGLNPKEHWHAVEFGANREKKETYVQRSPKGRKYQITRRVNRGLRSKNSKGYVFYPAAREMVPRLASLLVQTVYRTIANATEGKRE